MDISDLMTQQQPISKHEQEEPTPPKKRENNTRNKIEHGLDDGNGICMFGDLQEQDAWY